MQRKRGHYLGTEVDGVWHKRYRKDGMLARGLGEYWIDDDVFCFRRYLTRNPIRVPLRRVVAVERGKWHAGRWVGSERAIKLIWERDGRQLSSGFVLTRSAAEAETCAHELRDMIAGLR